MNIRDKKKPFNKIKNPIKSENNYNFNSLNSFLSQEEINVFKKILAKIKNHDEKIEPENSKNNSKDNQSKNKEIYLDASIFSNLKLGVFESVVKYLVEELNFSLKEISFLLNKKYSTVSNTYQKAKSKQSEKINFSKSNIQIPLSIFCNSNIGPLENVVYFLKIKLNLKNIEISSLINRNPKTIWSTYNNIKNSKSLLKEYKLFINEELNNKIQNINSIKPMQIDYDKNYIDLNLFNSTKLGVLELLTKYLKENKSYEIKEISKILEKNYSTIWNSYNNAVSKQNEKLFFEESNYKIPISIFKNDNKNIGPLELLIIYLKDNLQLKNSVISKLINKSPKTIWSSYNNAKIKINTHNKKIKNSWNNLIKSNHE